MKILQFLCVWFSIACTTPANPVPDDAGTYDFSKFPGCVSRSKEVIQRNIPLSQLRYKSIAGKETDEEELHKAFIARALEKIQEYRDKKSDNYLYLTFAIYYRFNKNVYKQFASAIICKEKFGTKDNECRNRNYYFFSHLDPITLANGSVA